MSDGRTFWLSMHVSYACRDSGRCCSSGWPIPLETPGVAALRRIRPSGGWLLPAPGAPPGVAGLLAVSDSGQCVFHAGGCEIQRRLGHAALPVACQHFPREVLIDRRGVFVTLSHYCPTAADLLFDHQGAVEIVAGPPVLPHADPQGLDAREVLPPLLCAGVLMDAEGYGAWEAHMVRVLTCDDGFSPEAAVARIKSHASELQRWRPGNGTLAEKVATLGAAPYAGNENRPDPFFGVIRRFLAAHAFASWMAYQGNGVEAVVGALELTLDTLRGELAADGGATPTRRQLKRAIAETDRRLVHEMPRDRLAQAASARYRRSR